MNKSYKVLKLLEKMNRQICNKGFPIFKANIKNGIVWVECRGYEIFVETCTYDGEGSKTRTQWYGTTVSAAKRLGKLEIDFDSIVELSEGNSDE